MWVLTFAGISGVGDDELYRVDPGSNDVLASIDIGRPGAGVAAGKEGVWVVTGGGDLQQIDTGTNRVRRSVPGIPRATGLALGGGFVWVSDAIQGVVYRVDPDSEQVDTIHLPGGADGIAADATGVWVMDRSSGSVVRIDPTSEDVGQQIRVGADPTSIAVGEGFVWVSDLGDGAVSPGRPGPARIDGDPRRRRSRSGRRLRRRGRGLGDVGLTAAVRDDARPGVPAVHQIRPPGPRDQWRDSMPIRTSRGVS